MSYKDSLRNTSLRHKWTQVFQFHFLERLVALCILMLSIFLTLVWHVADTFLDNIWLEMVDILHTTCLSYSTQIPPMYCALVVCNQICKESYWFLIRSDQGFVEWHKLASKCSLQMNRVWQWFNQESVRASIKSKNITDGYVVAFIQSFCIFAK